MKEEQLKKQFGQRVRLIRKSQNLTQEKLSEMIDLDPQHFCKMENGTNFPSPKNLVKIADALNVEVQDLFAFNSSDKTLEKIIVEVKNLTPKELDFLQTIINALSKLK